MSDSPNRDKELFEVKIDALYNEAIAALRYHDFDELQEQHICSYANALVDLYNEDNFPKSVIADIDDVIDTIEEAWQMTCALVEDMMFRRMFILICTNVLMTITWEGNDEVTPEFIASLGVKL